MKSWNNIKNWPMYWKFNNSRYKNMWIITDLVRITSKRFFYINGELRRKDFLESFYLNMVKSTYGI